MAGCGGKNDVASSSTKPTSTSGAASTSTSAAASATPNYASLLAKPSDLPPIAGEPPWTAAPPRVIPPDPPGVAQTYSAGPSYAIDTSIAVSQDAAAAALFLKGSAEGVPAQVTGGTQEPLPAVSGDAMFTSGRSAKGNSSEAALLFTVQNTTVIMIFAGPLDKPVPQDFAEAVGKVQVTAIQAALPGVR